MKETAASSREDGFLKGEGKRTPYPKSVWFIISNEFCERFSFYGMRAILVLFFRYVLLYSENAATQAFHIFAMACYFTPVLGAILADSFLGKFWTILSISIVYAIGNIVLSFSAVDGVIWMTYLGLAFIALGTGGIKPCVSAFGGDQFQTSQTRELQQFFSFFYISINAGSLISTFITPILRQDVTCFGRDDCYPLAFGVPAILMVLAVLLFVLGKFLTNYRINPPSENNIVLTVLKCVFYALSRKLCGSSAKKSHWLEYADDKFDRKTIHDVRALMAILFLYLPLPIFWALFDQQASRWTLQATRMNGQVVGSFTIKPDQIQVINPLLVILMIPVFEYAIYPLMTRLNFFHRPLQKMTIGGLLAALSFVICAFVQLKIEQEQPVALLPHHHHVVLVNGFAGDCSNGGFRLESPLYNGTVNQPALVLRNIPAETLADFSATFVGLCDQTNQRFEVQTTFANLTEGASLLLYIDSVGLQEARTNGGRLPVNSTTVRYSNMLSKPLEGGALLFTLFNLTNYEEAVNRTTGADHQSTTTTTIFTSSDHSGELRAHVLRNSSTTRGSTTPVVTTLGFLDPFEVEIKGSDIVMGAGEKRAALKLQQGATYFQLISGDLKGDVHFTVTKIVEANQLSVFIQLIQYLVITCAEIMFSVTGLEFSYTQAPQSMKSVLQAAWLLTVAFGNLIVAVIADLKIFPQQSYEFFFFATLMAIDIAIFAVMAYFYAPFRGEPSEGSAKVASNGNGTAASGTADHQLQQQQQPSSAGVNGKQQSMQMEPINQKRKTSSSSSSAASDGGWDK